MRHLTQGLQSTCRYFFRSSSERSPWAQGPRAPAYFLQHLEEIFTEVVLGSVLASCQPPLKLCSRLLCFSPSPPAWTGAVAPDSSTGLDLALLFSAVRVFFEGPKSHLGAPLLQPLRNSLAGCALTNQGSCCYGSSPMGFESVSSPRRAQRWTVHWTELRTKPKSLA